MNLIVCDQMCRHQQAGYCSLNHIESLTNAQNTKCGYFSPGKPLPMADAAEDYKSAPYYTDRL